jgi:hypothetical protein
MYTRLYIFLSFKFKMMTIIHTFDDVSLTNEGTLIVCDIDDTLLRYERNLNYFYQKLKI